MKMRLLIGLLLLAGCAGGEKDYSGPETQGGASVNVFPEKYRAEILDSVRQGQSSSRIVQTPDGRAALFYNSGYYGREQLYLKESSP